MAYRAVLDHSRPAQGRPALERTRPKGSGEPAPDSPNSGQDLDVAQIMENMMSSSRKRRDAKRKLIEVEHGKRITEARRNIDVIHNSHKKRMLVTALARSKSHKTQVEIISALIKKRLSIETKIVSVLEALEVDYLEMASTEWLATLTDNAKLSTPQANEVESITAGRLNDLDSFSVPEGNLQKAT
ncbi:MAG: hypothetical protein M1839_005559 [Geoglossum umbratile]|nr:MAG: hypothetical protein M1839_005559 [Geoglossum umbratile]